MKKFLILALVCALLMVIPSTALANRIVDEQANTKAGHTGLAEIKPEMEIHDPGRVKLNIAWSNPVLTFGAVIDGEPDEYRLKQTFSTPFTLTNQSLPGKGLDAFNGTLAIYANGSLGETYTAENNTYRHIDATLETIYDKPSSVLKLSNDPTGDANKNSEDFAFQYAENTSEEWWEGEPTTDTVQLHLTATVVFRIMPQTDAA